MHKLFPWLLVGFASAALANPGDDLQTIIDEHWAWHLEQSPTTRTHQECTRINRERTGHRRGDSCRARPGP